MNFKEVVYKSDNKLPGVNILTTKEECEKCVDILMKSDAVTAWDT